VAPEDAVRGIGEGREVDQCNGNRRRVRKPRGTPPCGCGPEIRKQSRLFDTKESKQNGPVRSLPN
jgi:hypothetical protein